MFLFYRYDPSITYPHVSATFLNTNQFHFSAARKKGACNEDFGTFYTFSTVRLRRAQIQKGAT